MALDLYSKATTDTLLAAKLDLAGGTMTGGLTLSASGIIFSDATYLTTAPAGSTLAADQLTAGVVTANPTAGPTASGDVLQYNGTDLVWAAGGGGGGATWGSITGTVTDQTDLTSYISGLGYITDAPIDGFPYVRKNGAWDLNTAPVGSVNWGSIGGYLVDQLDLQSVLDTKLDSSTAASTYLPLAGGTLTGTLYVTDTFNTTTVSSNQVKVLDQFNRTAELDPTYIKVSNGAGSQVVIYDSQITFADSTVQTTAYTGAVPGKSVNSLTGSHTLASGDTNNIVFVPAGYSSTITIPDDATYSFPVGTDITLIIDGSSSPSVSIVPQDTMTPAPVIVGVTSFSATAMVRMVKVAANLWIID